jgi:hypothetical protein
MRETGFKLKPISARIARLRDIDAREAAASWRNQALGESPQKARMAPAVRR